MTSTMLLGHYKCNLELLTKPADWQATVSTARAELQKPFLFSTPEVSQPLRDAPWHLCFMQRVANAINASRSFDSAL